MLQNFEFVLINFNFLGINLPSKVLDLFFGFFVVVISVLMLANSFLRIRSIFLVHLF
jgi:hypothetical protein